MNITDQLLDKYFKGLCTPEEQSAVNSFLCETEEWPDHLITMEEWDEVGEMPLSEEKTDQLFTRIKAQTFPVVRNRQWLRNMAAAAGLLLLLTVGALVYMRISHQPKIASYEKPKYEKSSLIPWKSTYNYGNEPEEIVLPDSSRVKVFPGSEISYQGEFNKTNREIYLKGIAYFNVRPNKSHPFTVHAGDLTTTALGTSFTITAPDNNNFIRVRLHTGKVLVKHSATADVPTIHTILLPGETFVLNKSTTTYQVLAKPKDAIVQDSLTVDFVQSPLPVVFTKLEQHFKVKIEYDEALVREMFFTGTIDLQIPLEQILNELATVNKLTPVKTKAGFEIRK